MTDLEQRIFRIVTSTRVQADIPGAIVAEIERTHVLVDRERWERVRLLGELSGRVLNFRLPITWPTVWDYTDGDVKMSGRIDPGDLDPIRHNAANCDTSEGLDSAKTPGNIAESRASDWGCLSWQAREGA